MSVKEATPAAPVRIRTAAAAAREAIPARAEWILALAGFCLIFLQFFMIREVTALLRGTEIVILLVTLSYFTGYSVGYGLARWLSFDRIRKFALAAWALHLTLPFSFRYLSGLFYRQVAAGMALTALLFLTAFALSSFYSVLLPRFIDQAEDGPQSLIRYYGVELGGAVVGMMALFLAGRSGWATAVLYQAALALLVVLLWPLPALRGIALVAFAVYALVYPVADRRSLSYSYSTIQELDDPKVLYSANTFYQRVDFLEDADETRYIYLNGRMNYGSDSLRRFNVILAKLPAVLVRPRRALIVGSGSMESVGHVSQFADHVTTVELDNAVVEGSRRYLADINRLAEIPNWNLVINDAKQFLGSTQERFDLIVMDVPAPTTIQLGLLHSVDFYQLARGRLTPHGVISVALSGRFARNHETPQTVASALVAVFKEVVVYTEKEGERSFALGGDSFPFTRESLKAAAAAVGSPGIQILDRPQVVEIVGDTPPMSADNMRHVVRRGWQRLKDLYLSSGSE